MNHLEQTVSQNTSDLENLSEKGIGSIADNAFKPNYTTLIEQLAKEAHRGCGLSFELYSRRFQSSVDALLERLPDNEKETAIALAEQHGYERDQPNVVQSSTPDWDEDTRFCSHGIELGCCPAGCGE